MNNKDTTLATGVDNDELRDKTRIVRERILQDIQNDWNVPVLHESDFRFSSHISADWRSYVHLGSLVNLNGAEHCIVVKEFNRQTATQVIDVPARVEKLYKYYRCECGIWRRSGTHENLVEIIGLLESFRGSIFPAIVMPYYPRRDLCYLVENDPQLSVRARARLMYDIVKGLSYLHNLPDPIVHRDIKGSNILVKDVSSCLVACIADFGSAKFLYEKGYDVTPSSKTASIDWTAPEHLEESDDSRIIDRKIVCACDMWSFACTFLEVLTARDPWGPDFSYEDVLLGQHPHRPADITIDGVYWSIMKNCWSRSPKERATAKDIAFFMGTLRLNDSRINQS